MSAEADRRLGGRIHRQRRPPRDRSKLIGRATIDLHPLKHGGPPVDAWHQLLDDRRKPAGEVHMILCVVPPGGASQEHLASVGKQVLAAGLSGGSVGAAPVAAAAPGSVYPGMPSAAPPTAPAAPYGGHAAPAAPPPHYGGGGMHAPGAPYGGGGMSAPGAPYGAPAAPYRGGMPAPGAPYGGGGMSAPGAPYGAPAAPYGGGMPAPGAPYGVGGMPAPGAPGHAHHGHGGGHGMGAAMMAMGKEAQKAMKKAMKKKKKKNHKFKRGGSSSSSSSSSSGDVRDAGFSDTDVSRACSWTASEILGRALRGAGRVEDQRYPGHKSKTAPPAPGTHRFATARRVGDITLPPRRSLADTGAAGRRGPSPGHESNPAPRSTSTDMRSMYCGVRGTRPSISGMKSVI